MFDLDDVLEKRKNFILKMMAEGFSDADIARYFEISPSVVKRSVSDENLIETFRSNNPQKIIDMMEERNKNVKLIPDENKDALCNLGFYFKPKNNQIVIKIAEELYGKEKDVPEYIDLYNGLKLWQIRNKRDYQSTAALNKYLKELNLDAKAVFERGKNYRNIVKNIGVIWELYADGFTVDEIRQYNDDISESKISKAITMAKEYGIRKNACEENIEHLIQNGYKFFMIAQLVGCSEGTVTKIKKKMNKNPLDGDVSNFKNIRRREEVYKLYFVEKKSQIEIAEKLKVTRGTVASDIQDYLREHPEIECDKADSNRRAVKVDTSHSASLAEKADEIIDLRLKGESFAKIVKATNVKEGEVIRFIKEQEQTPNTRLNRRRKELGEQIEKLRQEGMLTREIAKTLKTPWRTCSGII